MQAAGAGVMSVEYRFLKCASEYGVPNASDDLPDPDTPVITTKALRGISSDTIF
jgi:hypothetical protein